MQAMISAIQNAYQPCEMPEIFMKIKRQGTNKISCLMALQKNKREICKDKQILMISRFYYSY